MCIFTCCIIMHCYSVKSVGCWYIYMHIKQNKFEQVQIDGEQCSSE